jgi:hypothetical protein
MHWFREVAKITPHRGTPKNSPSWTCARCGEVVITLPMIVLKHQLSHVERRPPATSVVPKHEREREYIATVSVIRKKHRMTVWHPASLKKEVLEHRVKKPGPAGAMRVGKFADDLLEFIRDRYGERHLDIEVAQFALSIVPSAGFGLLPSRSRVRILPLRHSP